MDKQPTKPNLPESLEQAITRGEVAEIKYCDKHWAELMFALIDRNLADQITSDPEKLRAKLDAGKMDPALEASSGITTTALQIFGPFPILEQQGCPVCCFQNIINHVADNMQAKYTEPS